MIEVLGYCNTNTYIKLYINAINVINIQTKLMNDECVPYRESTAGMVWLNNDMLIGEIEYICPKISEVDISVKDEVAEIYGTPQLKVHFEEKPIELFVSQESLTVILNREKSIERKCLSSDVVFYLNGD